MQEADAFLGDAIDVGRLVTHQTAAVSADVGDPDVVTEDDEDVGFCRRFFDWASTTPGAISVKPGRPRISRFLFTVLLLRQRMLAS